MIQTRMPYVAKWLPMKRDQVLDKFMTRRGAFTDGKGQYRFVFVPGSRDDRVLIVAHADTVWDSFNIRADYHAGVLFSKDRSTRYELKKKHSTVSRTGIGIGADDRAGCAIAWRLKELGHSILITSGEEIGCLATHRLMKSKHWRKIIASHSFAVQFDRRGRKDIVFYDVGTNAFVKYVKEQTGYTPESGMSTDIKHLCKKICGVNMSVGYYDEHQSDERLAVDQWENTLGVAHNWLKQPNLPKFKFEQSDIYRHNYFDYHCHPAMYGDDYCGADYKIQDNTPRSDEIKTVSNREMIKCYHPGCGAMMTTAQWFEKYCKCIKCGHRI